MPKRTISEAREALETLTLSPRKQKEYEKFLTDLVDQGVARIHSDQAESYAALSEQVTEVKEALREVEGELRDLEKQSRQQDIGARDYRERFSELQDRRQSILRRARSIESRVKRYIEVEQDPEGHLDGLYRKYPAVRPEFPW